MLTGFNTNIRHRGVLFHVQTEDSGRAHPHVITHLYHGGTILSSEKRGYHDRLEVEDLVGEVKSLMEAQHKEMLKRLRRGEFDAVIEERLGAEVFVHAQDVSAQTQPEGLAPPEPEMPIAASSHTPAAPDAPLDELVLDYLVDRALERARRRVTAEEAASSAPAPAAPSALAPASAALIELEHVSKSYVAGTWALHDVSCAIRKGEFVFLTGASGAGKTTLLRLLFAAERPNEGRIRVLGRAVERMGGSDVARLRRRIGVVFQDFKLLPRHSVEENVRIALDVAGVPGGEARARSFAALKQVGLQHRRHHAPQSLSGGEQQRVAIARALVNEPDLLLADEPTGNLDPELTLEIFDLIAASAARGTTVVVATHDPVVLERYRRRTLRLEAGRIAEDRPGAGGRA